MKGEHGLRYKYVEDYDGVRKVYTALCVCGVNCRGWSPEEADDCLEEHINNPDKKLVG